MKAMILAAGLGRRLHPLTETTPKPMLEVNGRPLLRHHIDRLRQAGVTELVINTARHGERIEACFGDGAAYGVDIAYSREGDSPLETGGGIFRALPLLGDSPFLVVNGDILTELDFASLLRPPAGQAHLVLVPNPPHHPQGDFVLGADGRLDCRGRPRRTYGGIGVYAPRLFRRCTGGAFPLLPLLRRAMAAGRVTGELYAGPWIDVGTPERLEEARRGFK